MNEQVKLDFESRMLIIKNSFCLPLKTMLRAHTHLRDDASAGMYMKQVADAINQRLSSEMNRDSFTEQVEKVWAISLSRHKSQFWFNISDVIKAATLVNTEWTRKFSNDKSPKTYGSEQTNDDKERKKGGNWTLEGAIAQLEATDALMMLEERPLNRKMGLRLRQIALKAIERLGGDVSKYETPPDVRSLPSAPAPMLKPAPAVRQAMDIEPTQSNEPKPDFDIIKSGMVKPTFEEEDGKSFDSDISIEEALNIKPKDTTSDWDSI
jgi:hypothetical protein